MQKNNTTKKHSSCHSSRASIRSHQRSRVTPKIKPFNLKKRHFSSRPVSFSPTAFTAPDDLPLGDSAFLSKSLYGSQPEMTYGGALSFLRRKYTRDVFGHGEDVC